MLVHPLISTLIRHPELVVEHLAGYGALLHEKASGAGSEVLHRLVAGIAAALCFIVFLMLAGTAAMLGLLNEKFHWALIVVPLISLALAIGFGTAARKPMTPGRFDDVKRQIDADVALLKTAGDR
ncbi:MAG: hypothetical protein ABW051_08625 [Burkholderiaceae bacterium]